MPRDRHSPRTVVLWNGVQSGQRCSRDDAIGERLFRGGDLLVPGGVAMRRCGHVQGLATAQLELAGCLGVAADA